MADGLRALMQVAVERQAPLPFRVAMYAGGMLLGGCIAPWWLMHDVTLATLTQQVDTATRKLKDPKQREAAAASLNPVTDVFTAIRSRESDAQDELTLYDATVLAPVGNSGGFRLPVVRVPLSSIGAWWVAEGDSIPGSGSGLGVGIGFLIPIN